MFDIPQSPKWKLDSIDLQKIKAGAKVAIAGVVLTYGTAVVFNTDFTVHIPTFSFIGITIDAVSMNLTAIVGAFWSIVANALRKFIADNTKD